MWPSSSRILIAAPISSLEICLESSFFRIYLKVIAPWSVLRAFLSSVTALNTIDLCSFLTVLICSIALLITTSAYLSSLWMSILDILVINPLASSSIFFISFLGFFTALFLSSGLSKLTWSSKFNFLRMSFSYPSRAWLSPSKQ